MGQETADQAYYELHVEVGVRVLLVLVVELVKGPHLEVVFLFLKFHGTAVHHYLPLVQVGGDAENRDAGEEVARPAEKAHLLHNFNHRIPDSFLVCHENNTSGHGCFVQDHVPNF